MAVVVPIAERHAVGYHACLDTVHAAVTRKAMRFDGAYFDSVQMSLLL